MTFDEAFDRAAAEAVCETVEGAPRTWSQRLGLARRDRWQPTPDERFRASEACRRVCRERYDAKGSLPSEWEATAAAKHEVGMGPLTWLWVAVMVARLLATLKDLLNRDA